MDESKPRAYPKNAPGPFYVENGCCITCALPYEASDMFALDLEPKNMHCYVCRQPETREQLGLMLTILDSAELECIRYRGEDAEILRRLAESGHPHLSDRPTPPGAVPLTRDHVTFEPLDPADDSLSLRELAALFEEHERQRPYSIAPKFKRLKSTRDGVVQEDALSAHEFVDLREPQARWLLRPAKANRLNDLLARYWLAASTLRIPVKASRPRKTFMSIRLSDWLSKSGRFKNVRWYASQDWESRGPWLDYWI